MKVTRVVLGSGGRAMYWMILSVVVLVFVALGGQRAKASAHLLFDMRDEGERINNKFSMLNSWFYDPQWRGDAAVHSDDDIAFRFPFVETVHLMTATGGSLERDLFENAIARDQLDDYHFKPLQQAIEQVLAKGLKPYIKTGNVPLKYSERPVIGTEFGVNVRPPDDYDVYYRYIKALAEHMVDAFGLDEVNTWMWGVLTEYENQDWFDAGSPSTTEVAYFKLYDYTVAALVDALGYDNVYVGAHSMTVADGYWDERAFIEHVARGTNYKTGEVGTKLDFLAVSFYDRTLAGFDHRKLIDTIHVVREKAEQVGLTDLRYGVDEGRVLIGWDGKPLISRAVNLSAQGAADAKLFKVMVDHDIDWFSLWGLRTGGTWSGADAIGSHIANLAYKMTGDVRIGGEVVQRSQHRSNEIDGVASYDPETHTVRLMVYNNQPNAFSGVDDTVRLEIRHLMPVEGDEVTVHQWRVDDDHGNWWPLWQADAEKLGLTDDDYTNWSKYSVEIPTVLRDPVNRNFWYSREAAYAERSELSSTLSRHTVIDGTVAWDVEMPAHGVVFYEIIGVKPAPVDVVIDMGGIGRDDLISGVVPVRVMAADGDAVWHNVTVQVDGVDVTSNISLPFQWDLNPAQYANGVHEVSVTATGVDGRTATERRRFEIDNVMAIIRPVDSARVSSVVPVEMAVGPGADDVEQFQLLAVPFGESKQAVHEIFSGDRVPELPVFDTLAVPDGAYDIVARLTTKYDTAYAHTVRVVVRNWEVFSDPLQPPAESWFGVHDRSKTVARSGGWIYATDDAAAFFGDADRVVRQADTVEYLVWELPRIDDFEITVYTAPELGEKPDLTALFAVGVTDASADAAANFSERQAETDGLHDGPTMGVNFSVAYAGRSDAGWTRWQLRGQVPAGSNVVDASFHDTDDTPNTHDEHALTIEPRRLTLHLMPSGTTPKAIQIGHVTIRYRLD